MELSLARELLLLVLLVKMLAAASMASLLGRFPSFKRLLFEGDTGIRSQFYFGLALGTALFIGTSLRVALRFQAPDLGVEGTVLAGVLFGHIAGIVAGALASLPAMANQEFLSFPFLIAAGTLGAFARFMLPSKEVVWHFSPFFDLNLYRWFRQRFGYPRGDWQMFFFLLLIVLEAARMHLGRAMPGRLFYLLDGSPWIVIAICLAAIASVAIPLTIWKNIRIELQLEEQNRLLIQARLDALTAQINPHFLFNTLNSIASLVRTNPETARQVIVKLSNILRRLLKKQDNFTSLSDEMSFIDDYLAIEVVRFGEQKLKIVKEIDEETLRLMVPSMMLQPIIENAIRHGLSPRVEGGEINIRSSRVDGRLLLEVSDNGIGIAASKIENVFGRGGGQGIGISNVQERLRFLYGSEFTFDVLSPSGSGTTVVITLPILHG